MDDAERRAAEEFEDETQRARLMVTLVELRQKQGITQAEVGRQMGWAQPTVSAFERGGQEGRDMSIWTVKRYARAIGVELRMWIEPKEPELVEPPAGKAEGSGEDPTT